MGRTSATVVYESPVQDLRDFFSSLSFRVFCAAALADGVLTACSTFSLNTLKSSDALAHSEIHLSFTLTFFFKFLAHAFFVGGLIYHSLTLQDALILNPECRTRAFKNKAMSLLLLEAFFCFCGASLNFLLLQNSFKQLTLSESNPHVSLDHTQALLPAHWLLHLYLKMALVWTTQFLTWLLFQAHFVKPLEQTPDTNLLENSFLPDVHFSIKEIHDDDEEEDPELAIIFYQATAKCIPCKNELELTD